MTITRAQASEATAWLESVCTGIPFFVGHDMHAFCNLFCVPVFCPCADGCVQPEIKVGTTFTHAGVGMHVYTHIHECAKAVVVKGP